MFAWAAGTVNAAAVLEEAAPMGGYVAVRNRQGPL